MSSISGNSKRYKLKQFHWHIDHNLIERIRVGMNVLRNAQLDCLFSLHKGFSDALKSFLMC